MKDRPSRLPSDADEQQAMKEGDEAWQEMMRAKAE